MKTPIRLFGLYKSLKERAALWPMSFGIFNIPGGTNLVKDNPEQTAYNVVERIAQIITNLAYPIAVIGIIYTAYLLLTSVGSPDGFTKVKKNVSTITIGIIIMLVSVVLINFLTRLFA